jgi:hypothetical protein
MVSELEGRGGASAEPDAAAAATEATEASAATAADGSDGTAAGAGAMPATTDPAAPAAEAIDPLPLPPPDTARVNDSLEAIKTAIVWLVVLQILTILSPLLRVSLKWSLVVGLVLTVSSFAVSGVAYLKARQAQRGLPE